MTLTRAIVCLGLMWASWWATVQGFRLVGLDQIGDWVQAVGLWALALAMLFVGGRLAQGESSGTQGGGQGKGESEAP